MARRRPRAEPGGDGSDRWLGTYGDMVTLLMAFFVMLYAISQVDDVKFLALVRGLDVFGNTTNLDGMLESGPSLLDEGFDSGNPDTGDGIGELSLDPKEPPPSEQPSERPSDPPTDAAEPPEPPSEERVARIRRQLADALRGAGLPGDLTDVRADPRGVVISVSSDDVLFRLGSSALTRTGRRTIGAIATVLATYRQEVLIEGHTDNLPLRRPGYSNWNLSTDRAVAVVQRLQRRHDIDQRRLVAVGYSRFRPLVPNTSAANRARNRRVDVLLRLNDEE